MTSVTPYPPPRPLLRSKTFWLNLLAAAGGLCPLVREWLAANPEAAVAVLAAANTALRLVSAGRVSVFPLLPGGSSRIGGSPRLPAWVLWAGLAGGIGCALPACTPGGGAEVPIHASYEAGSVALGYDSAGGITVVVDQKSRK